MKSQVVICFLILFLFFAGLSIFKIRSKFNINFASHALFTYAYGETNIVIDIEDEDVISELKTILNGYAFKDSPSCGFADYCSMEFIGESKSVILYPTLDGCSIIRIGKTDKYIDISKTDRLIELLYAYGFIFPCV